MRTCKQHILRHSAVSLVFLFSLFSAAQSQAQEFRYNSGGGPITLLIQTATAGSEPNDATDNATEIYWDANFGAPSKITVSTIAPGQSFQLFLLLSVPSQGGGGQGVAQPEVTLVDGMLDADLFTDIPSSLPGRQGFGTLEYRAAATVADGNSSMHGDDVHIVTLTVLAQ